MTKKVRILRKKNSEIKIRILKKDSVFWAKSRILRKKSEIWRKKNFEDKEFWEKSQNPDLKLRVLGKKKTEFWEKSQNFEEKESWDWSQNSELKVRILREQISEKKSESRD